MTTSEFNYGTYGDDYKPGLYEDEVLKDQLRYEIPERQKLSKSYLIKFNLQYNL